MELLSELMKILLTINNALLYPVLILLIILVGLCFIYVGDMISDYSRRNKDFNDKFNGGYLESFYNMTYGYPDFDTNLTETKQSTS